MIGRGGGILLAAASAAVLILTGQAFAGEVLWWTPNWGEARARELAQKFEAANPGITIKLEITASDGLLARIQTALLSGSPPDLIEAQHVWVAPYAQAGLVLPLDDLLEDKDDYVQAALDYDMWDGKLWGVPYRIDTQGVIYNKGAFSAAGLDPDTPPETWEELVDAAKKLTGDDKYGFAITGGGEFGDTVFGSLPFIWMNGGSIISEDMTKATVNEPTAVEAVKFYTGMLIAHHVSLPSTLQNDGAANRRLFITETVAMYQSDALDVASIREENANIDIGVMMIPHPEDKETAAIIGGWSFIIPKDAKNPDDAKKFVKFLAESDNMGFFTETLPARVSAMDLERFWDPILANFKAMLPHGRRVPRHRNWIPITQAYFEGLQRILRGEATPQESMDQAAGEIQALLDQ